jgi:hypothetical protein
MLAELIRTLTDVSPLELLGRAVMESRNREITRAIFSSYDRFLEVLADPAARQRLEEVQFEDAVSDPTYTGLREESQTFREGVTRLFFDSHPKLPKLIRNFGVF